jgi:hypothetical protein
MRTTQRAVLTSLAVAASALGAGAGSASALETTACPDSGRLDWARVQLFAGAGCSGGQMAVKATDPSPDRPSFASFTNFDGRRYDVDNSRSSLRIAAGTCVRLYDGPNYTGDASSDICAKDHPLEWELERFDDRASSMRVFAVPGGSTPAPAPSPEQQPAAAPAPAPGAAPAASPAADRATTWAESKVGVRECSSEQTGWVRNYAPKWGCGTAWCGIFLTNAFKNAGVTLKGQYSSTEWIHDSAIASRNGLRAVSLDQVRRGDLVLMYTRKLEPSRAVGHVGIARGPMRDGAISTVEGNISDKVVAKERSVTARYNAAHKLVVLVARVGG